jgi:hypothetical protein
MLPSSLGFYFIAQSPSPGPSAAASIGASIADFFKTWQPTLAIIIAFAALGISIYALIRTSAVERRRSLLEKIKQRIDDLDRKSAEAAGRIICNITGEVGKATPRKLRSEVYAKLQRLESLRSDLEGEIPRKQDDIFRAFKRWHGVVTSDPFPVEDPKYYVTRHSDAVHEIERAQKIWHTFLMQLERGCVTEKIKFWKRRKRSED